MTDQEHAEKIKRLTEDLRLAIAEAQENGLEVETPINFTITVWRKLYPVEDRFDPLPK